MLTERSLVGFRPFQGEWSEAGQHQCEEVNSCVYQNGTDVFGVCCEKKVLYGQHTVLFLYCCAMTVGATMYLASRDRRMLSKLERTIALTESKDPGAETAQREFALHWEVAAMFGGLFAYMIGKVWNDSASVWFAAYKSESPLAFALISTTIGIVFVLLDASGKMGKIFDCVGDAVGKARSLRGGTEEGLAATGNAVSGKSAGGSLSMELIEKS